VRVQVRDVRLYFDVVGAGLVANGPAMRERPVLICLHGGPGFDHSTLKEALSPLAEVAQLVFVDQRGNGRSDRSTPDRWNLGTWIDDIPAFCEALELERPMLLGQSFGGFVALGVAARHPQLPAKLIVSSGAARIRMDRALAMFERLGGAEARAAAERNFTSPSVETRAEYLRVCVPLYNPSPPDPNVLRRVVRHDDIGIHFWSDEIHRFDLGPELAAIRAPTLILGGELDPITTAEDVRELADAIPDARLEMFTDAGHGVFRERPAETLALIREFIVA
jgi:pimeloyl-ACP methyl ester carboxylesterase